MLVQDQPLRAEYVIIPARIPSRVRVEQVATSVLPKDWRATGPNETLREIGEQSVRRSLSAVLRVPSAVVPQEHNYLLNPAHVDFRKIKIGQAEALTTDQRLVARFGAEL